MSIGLNPKVNVKGLKELKEYIEFVKKFSTMKTDRQFQKYIQNKFLETVNRIASDRLSGGILSQEYISNNKIREFDDGFILYNDTMVATESEGYDGQFSIALAFEYGTGIVGQNHPKANAWAYNINQHEKGWIYYADGSYHFTQGFEGFEIYRFTKEEVERNLNDWVMKYKKADGGVSQ